MSDKSTTSAGGGGVLGLLGVAFVVMKLCHVINWPWLWVLAPFWVPAAVALVICVIALLIWAGVTLAKSKRRPAR